MRNLTFTCKTTGGYFKYLGQSAARGNKLRAAKTMKATKYNLDRRSGKTEKARLQNALAQFPGGVPRPEYPRPQLRRPDWVSLNGQWEFSGDAHDIGLSNRWQEKKLVGAIVVPFAPQYELSGQNSRQMIDFVWYARDFQVSDAWREAGKSVLLHIGACDYKSTVWINGHEVGHNQGGHVPFWFDITPYLDRGNNRISLRAEDKQDAFQPRGKQSVSGQSKGCDYFCTTGIWQTVWLESVPSLRIHDLTLMPHAGADAGQDALDITVHLHAPSSGWHLQVEVLESDEDDAPVVTMAEDDAALATARLHIPLPNAKRWSPDTPHLYGIRVRLLKNGALHDEVRSYAGIRSVRVKDGEILLNGEPIYLKTVLDQGYWPDGGMTAPTDEALRADVEWTKQFGFNGARKHQKVEDPRWLYWCDKLGLLVWGEMANARMWRLQSEEWFLNEWERAVRRDLNHPCIVTWVPLNESWGVPDIGRDHAGQYAFVERMVALTRRLDASRPVIDNDGWEHTDVTDIVALHDYTTGEVLKKRYAGTLETGELPARTWGSKRAPLNFVRGAKFHGQPVVFSEVGGFLNIPEQSEGKLDPLYSIYGTCRGPEELLAKYRELMEALASLPFLSGFCYTQLTDIEQEANGLLTYDRKPKVAPELIAAVHATMFDSKKNE